jgi:biotin operon repressor
MPSPLPGWNKKRARISARAPTRTEIGVQEPRVRAQGVGVVVGVVRTGDAARVVRLLLLCQDPRGVSVAEAGATLGVVARTVHRDVAVLRVSGVPVACRGGRYYVDT